MKKIYAVYAKVGLIKSPDWLEDFRNKYDQPYAFHITLKQSAYVDEGQLGNIKQKLERIFDQWATWGHKISVVFDDLVLDEYDQYDKCGYIYIFSKQSKKVLNELQIEIKNALKQYSDYVSPESREYEDNFKPHITIARGLTKSSFEQAVADLGEDFVCEGEIKEVILSCINEINVEEAGNPANQIVFKL